jgi:hypothetical protein
MKAKIVLALIAVLFVAAFIWGFRRLGNLPPDPDDVPVSKTPSKPEPIPGTVPGVTLEPAAQKLIGLQSAPVAATTLPPEVPAFARIVDPTPLVGLVKDLATARNDLEASTKVYDRVKILYSQGLSASAAAFETAQAALKRDQIGLHAAQSQLEAAWGKAIAQRPDLTAFVQSLITLDVVIVRLDLPAGKLVAERPAGGRLVLPGKSSSAHLRFLGRALATDPQMQGQGFLFLAQNGGGSLTPGQALPAYLQLPGKGRPGVIVPSDAVVRYGDQTWVYVQTGEKKFERRSVRLDRPVDNGWFVEGTVAAGDPVVVAGAQTLLSEEMKAQIKVAD